MTDNQIELKCKKAVAFRVCESLENINNKDDLTNDLGFDSLDHAEYIQELELIFGIYIPDTKAEEITNIETTVKVIKELWNNKEKKDLRNSI